MAASASRVGVRPLLRTDASALIAAHRASVALHRPWVSPCLDQAGFEAWFARTLAEDYVSLIAHERDSGAVVGVFNASQISRGNLLSPRYLRIDGIWQDHERWALLADEVGC